MVKFVELLSSHFVVEPVVEASPMNLANDAVETK